MSTIQRLIKISLLNATGYTASNWDVLNGVMRFKTGDATFTAGQSPDGFDSTFWKNKIIDIGAIDEVSDLANGSGFDIFLGANFTIFNANKSIGSMLDDFEENEIYLEGANVEIYDNNGTTSKTLFSGKVRDLYDNYSSLTINCCSKLELSDYKLPQIILGTVDNYPIEAEISTNYFSIINESDYTAATISRVVDNYQAKVYKTLSISDIEGKLLSDSSGNGGPIYSERNGVIEITDSSIGEFSVLSDGSGDVVTISESEFKYKLSSGEFEKLNVGNLSEHNFTKNSSDYTYSCTENRPDGKSATIYKPSSVIVKPCTLNDSSGVTVGYYSAIGSDIYGESFTDLNLNNGGVNLLSITAAGFKIATRVNLNFQLKFDDDFNFNGKKIRWEVVKSESGATLTDNVSSSCTPVLLDDSTINGYSGNPSYESGNASFLSPIRFNAETLEKYSNTNPYLMNVTPLAGDYFEWDEIFTDYVTSNEAPFGYRKGAVDVNGKIYYDRGNYDCKIRVSSWPLPFNEGDEVVFIPSGNVGYVEYIENYGGLFYVALRGSLPGTTFPVGDEIYLYPSFTATGITVTETYYYDANSRFLYWSIVDGEWSVSGSTSDTGDDRDYKPLTDSITTNLPTNTLDFQKFDESETLNFTRSNPEFPLFSSRILNQEDLANYHRHLINQDNVNFKIKNIEPKFLKENGVLDFSISFDFSSSLSGGTVYINVCNFYLEDVTDQKTTTADISGETWEFGTEYGYTPKFSLPIIEYLLVNYANYNTSLFSSDINPSAVDYMGYNFISSGGKVIDELENFAIQSPYRLFQSSNGQIKSFDWKLLSGLEEYTISKAFTDDEIGDVEVSETDLTLVKNNDRIEYGYNYSTQEYDKYFQFILSSNSWNLSICVDTNDSAILNSPSLVSTLQNMWEAAKESSNLTGNISGDVIKLKSFKNETYPENRIVNFLNNRINSFAFRHKLYSFGISNEIFFDCNFDIGDVISISSLEKTGNSITTGIVSSISILGQNVNIQMIGFSEGLSIDYIDESAPYSGDYIDESAPYSGDYIDEV